MFIFTFNTVYLQIEVNRVEMHDKTVLYSLQLHSNLLRRNFEEEVIKVGDDVRFSGLFSLLILNSFQWFCILKLSKL